MNSKEMNQALKKIIPIFFGIGVLVTLISCTEKSPTVQYFFIEQPELTQNKPADKFQYSALLLFKKAVSVSPYNSVNFVVKTRPSEVKFYNFVKWVAPPPQMVHHYLKRSLNYGQLVKTIDSRVSSQDLYEMDVEVLEFGQNSLSGTPQGLVKIYVGLKKAGAKGYDWHAVLEESEAAASDSPYHVVQAVNTAMARINNRLLSNLDQFFASQSSQE